VNKLRALKTDLGREAGANHHAPRSGIDMIGLIVRHKVDPIPSMSTQAIGRGAFGRVTRETDPNAPENQIAVKRLECCPDWSVFVREIGTLVSLRHPCIVQLIGWSRGESNSLEIQMKLAANGALSDHLRGGRRAFRGYLRDSTLQARLICDIVLGMRFVHSRGIIHRDLKPANILLDENWRGLICDFGLSRRRTATGLPTPYAGTFDYAAPEQWEPETCYDEKVDVFTFGLVAYEIIADSRARYGTDSLKLRDPPREFGELMRNVIRGCWSLNPCERPSFEAILNEFETSGWAILPRANANMIAKSVMEVQRLENLSKRNTR
jgi:serine/threonine protein kinase